MPMAVALVASAVISGVAARNASKKAAKGAQAGVDAQYAAIESRERMFDETREDLAPYRALGGEASARVRSEFLGINPDGSANPAPDRSEFYKSPGYQFRLDEGLRGVENSAAASRLQLSGRTVKELNRYASDYASKEYGGYIDRLFGLTTLGANAAAQTGTIGAKYAEIDQQGYNSISAGYKAQGDALAAGEIGKGRAIGQAFSGISGGYETYKANAAVSSGVGPRSGPSGSSYG